MSTPRELLDALADTGVEVDDVWELVNARSVDYPAAVPVLLDWLEHLDQRVPEADRRRLRDGLVRALTVKSARPQAAPLLIDLFKRADDPTGFGERWVIGNALAVVADDTYVDELAALATNRSYGKGRQMLVLGLGRFSDPRIVPLLIGLLDDDDVVGHAAEALGKLKAAEARPALEPLLTDKRAVVRREAKKALAKIGAAAQR